MCTDLEEGREGTERKRGTVKGTCTAIQTRTRRIGLSERQKQAFQCLVVHPCSEVDELI
jgi:hypothetical protein